MAEITLSEYAARMGKDLSNVSKKFRNGDFKSARKVGKIVLIDEDEPYSDHRLKNGKWVDFRKNLDAGKRDE